MSWRLFVSPVVVLALTTALLISLSFHFGEDGHLEVNSFFRSGPETRPTLRIDFDASLADDQDFASLARLEGRVMFEELLERVPEYELESEPEWVTSHWARAYGKVPVRFDQA